ncbi:helix-turn-helix transcriptional regulator [Paenibacillus hemerocallicola]|uniref:Helix-turn-helix transcriptional regulator n=1 Tax=Paenibacillus hemerocallicola TaxID=1172614 RepID=A0A5C4T786_9BACL|nr:helix-turn-helix domain-containing protein [Paenibacillus hemerocallicola]TNJ64964.1 helix-turn-helix transcriptional regulator [Paenibacillus hemerocallicola]
MMTGWREHFLKIPRYMLLLLAFSTLIGTIPVLALGLFSYYTASGDVEQKIKESNMQVLLQTQMRVEQFMKMLELTAMQYANSPQVTSVLNGPVDVTDFVRIRNLHTGMYNLQTLSGISEGYLIGSEHNWVISFTAVAPLDEFPLRRQLELYAKHPNNLFWDIDPLPEEASRPPTVRMVYKLPILPFTEQPKGFLVIEMLKTQFRNLLAADHDKLGDIYVLNREGSDFLSDNAGRGESHRRVHDRIAETVLRTGHSSGVIHDEIDGTKMMFAYRGSSNGWIYVSAVSLDEINRQTRKIAIATFVACSIIFAVVGVLALLISLRMYSPIKRLSEVTKIGHIGETGSRDEFISMEERFRTLFSTGQQLKQQMQGQFTQLNEFLMLKLFTGQLSERDFASRSEQFGFPAGWKRLAVLTLQIDTLQDTRYRDHDKDLLLFAIHNMVGELIPAGRRFSPVLLDRSQVTLVTSDLDSAAELKAFYYGIAEQLKTKVREYLQVQVSIGISRPFSAPTDAVRAYNEGLEALRSRIYLGGGIIVHVEDVQSEHREPASAAYTKLKGTEDQLIKALKSGEPEKATEWFDKYMSEMAEHNASVNEYPVFMMQLVSRLYQIVQEQGGAVHQVLGEQASYGQLMKRSTPHDISEWFKRDLLAPIVDFLNRQAESQYIGIVSRMVKLVQERYDQDISLEGCAETLNFHPVYLSRVFKKEMGVTFSEYLAEFRMGLAKEWLETSTMKLSEIAERLNYSNTTAFIRIFRKVVGMTPGQYRERHHKA